MIRDALDILRHVRGPREVGRALLPTSWRGLRVLNDAQGDAADTPPETQPPTDQTPIDQTLRQLRNRLKTDALSEDGDVDYSALRSGALYGDLQRAAEALRSFDPASLDGDAARTAFWINLYNVLSIHGVIALGIERSVMEIPAFFDWVAYRVGGHTFTPNEIEHGVLRRNAADPIWGRPTFAAGDPRIGLSPSQVDPRIHMALVCVAQSCPPVGFYEAERLDYQLEMAASNLVNAGVRVDDDRRRVQMSLIFKMYRADFDAVGGELAFAASLAEPPLREALDRARASGYRVTYDRYDWSLNSLA